MAVVPLGRASPRYARARHQPSHGNLCRSDNEGNEKTWDSEIVNLFEAHRRARAGESVVRRDHGENTSFKFSLAGGEYVEMEHHPGRAALVSAC